MENETEHKKLMTASEGFHDMLKRIEEWRIMALEDLVNRLIDDILKK